MTYSDRFEALIAELKQTKNIEVQCSDLGGALPPNLVESECGLSIAPELVAFYSEMDGAEISWTVKGGAEHLCGDEAIWRGKIEIFPSFMLTEKRDWSDAVRNLDLDQETASLLENFVPFDWSGDEASVGLMVRDGRVESSIWVLNGYTREFHQQEHAFDDYIEALLRSKGLTSWRMLWDMGEDELAFEEVSRKMTLLSDS